MRGWRIWLADHGVVLFLMTKWTLPRLVALYTIIWLAGAMLMWCILEGYLGGR
jgi:hypothetical protein